MRIVATFAAILALPWVAFADEAQSPEATTTISQPAASLSAVSPGDVITSGKYDTSVYHLKHTRARQVIPAVRQAICKSLAAEAAAETDSQPTKPSVVSVVFMPTTSDDTLVAICPREHADLVKQAVEACDVEKQYAVKVQLFEISPTGEAVRVGDPAVVVGREGSVECKTSGECPVTLKLQVCDAAPVAAALSKESVETEPADEAYCSGPDCGRPEVELTEAKSACPGSCTLGTAAEATCPTCSGQCALSAKGQCAACSGKSHACQGQRTASFKGECAACSDELATTAKTECAGTCSGQCALSGKGQCAACNAKNHACQGECAACSDELATTAKTECAATCSGQCASSPGTCTGSCGQCQSLTGDEYRALVRILVSHWRQEHEGHVAEVGHDVVCPSETGDSSSNVDSTELQNSLIVPATSAEASAEKTGVELGCPAPAPSTSANDQTAAPCDQAPVPTVTEATEEGRLFVHRSHSNDEGFRFTGIYNLCPGDQDDAAVTRVTDKDDCTCGAPAATAGEHAELPNSCGGESSLTCQGPSAEPPALLTLSARKDGPTNLNIAISPKWQSDLSKIYQGRRLSEIFDPHNGQDAGSTALGRLLAEIPKPGCENDADNSHRRNVIVVDLPDRIRVFETVSGTEQVALPPCVNCREQFRAYLEEVFRGSNTLDEIAQTGHTEYDPIVAETPRDLPSVTRSKLETTVVTYPLRDLVLLDDAERPVFDTCTIIDHIESSVAPESWGHPSVGIQLDQQTMSLVIRQTPDVHKKIQAHLRDLRRLQVKQLGNLIERLTVEPESSDD